MKTAIRFIRDLLPSAQKGRHRAAIDFPSH